MIKASLEELKELCRTHSCSEHPDLSLCIAWHKKGFWTIRCGGDHYPDMIQKELTPSALFRQGEGVPLYIEKAIQRRYGMEEQETLQNVLPERTDRGTGAALTTVQKQLILAWCDDVGLKPWLGHVCVLYGNIYPTVDGLLYHARRQCPGIRTPTHFLTREEREEIGLAAEDIACCCTVYNKEGEILVNRLGVVRTHELTDRSEKKPEQLRYPIVAQKPHEMAENRAIWDALMDAFPLGIEERDVTREEKPAGAHPANTSGM